VREPNTLGHSTYQYHGDGRVSLVHNLDNPSFDRKGSYDFRAALGLAIGSIPAVLIAAFIVKSLDLYYVRWLVVMVIVFTALAMLRSAASERKSARESATAAAS